MKYFRGTSTGSWKVEDLDKGFVIAIGIFLGVV